ncbi:MAG: sugar kinase [Pyrinomonadaceae bacterium]
MSDLQIKSKTECRWDLISLGEVLLRFDPGDERIHNARSFRVFDGGAEYNVARGLSKVFRQRTAIATVLADNALGRLAEDFILQAGVDTSEIVWREIDNSSGNATRNGLYFIERGFGLRAPNSAFDRANTAISQVKAGDFDWQRIFVESKTRWFHTGGVFTGLAGDNTSGVALEAIKTARKNGVVVSFDLNYRDSLWKNRGGKRAANELNKIFLPFVDVVFGVLSEDFNSSAAEFDSKKFRRSSDEMRGEFPNLKIIASTLRDIESAGLHDFSAAADFGGEIIKARNYRQAAVLDRVGSGDSFASGFIYALLEGKGEQFAVDCGAAHGALAMTSVGDNSTARLPEIERLISGADSSVIR